MPWKLAPGQARQPVCSLGGGVTVTATEPDGAMLTELHKHVPANVRTVQAAIEDLRPAESYGLVFAAAALHWTNPEGRWPPIAAMLEPGGVFASFGGPGQLADAAVAEAVRAARAPFLESDEVELTADITVHLARRRRQMWDPARGRGRRPAPRRGGHHNPLSV
jgi:trans-aconitate methyltransferase